MPLDQVEYDDFHARVRSLEDRLMALRNAAIPETVPEDDFHSAIEGLFNAIHEKDVKMRDLLNGKPAARRRAGPQGLLRRRPAREGRREQSVKPFLDNLFDRAKRQLAAEGVNVRGARIDTGDLAKKLKAEFCQTLNERPWNVINKTLTSSVGGRPLELHRGGSDFVNV